MNTTLGKRIAGYRKGLELTQDQLAEQLGLTAQAVSKWENDLSCPDITILPKLADIFQVSIDDLLGHTAKSPVCETTVVSSAPKGTGFEYNSNTGKLDFHWNGPKVHGIGLACWVLLTGILYLSAQLIAIEVTFWNILWPALLLVFGLFGLYPKFSVFRFGCSLAGAYFLADKMCLLTFQLNKGIIFAVWVLLFGLGLLVEVLRKQRKGYAHYKDYKRNVSHGKICNDYQIDGNCFTYDASFGDTVQLIEMEKLQCGHISTNFGDYTVDLSGVNALVEKCTLHADCSFGCLRILVPNRFMVCADSSTSFANFDIQGQPNAIPVGTIFINADVSFGEITVQYI